MMVNVVWWSVAAVLLTCVGASDDSTFDVCVKKDSISCIQQYVYRKLRGLFGRESLDLMAGFQLVKTDAGRSLDDNFIENYDEKILGEGTVDIPERQAAIEDYAYQRMVNFFKERTWTWAVTPALDQFTTTARMAAASIPLELRDNITHFVVQGRGKKKMMKNLMPLFLLLKAKMASLMALAYGVIFVIAKKALAASLIALVITLFISLKKLLAKHHQEVYYEVEHHHSAPYHDRSGWSPAWSNWDSFDSAGQNLAYSQHKPNLR